MNSAKFFFQDPLLEGCPTFSGILPRNYSMESPTVPEVLHRPD